MPATKNTPFVMIPVSIAFDTTLPPLARLLWAALEHHSGKDPTCWPGYKALARDIGCSSRWIPVLLGRLVKAGLVVIHSRQGKTNSYRLIGRVARQPQPPAVKPTQEPTSRPPMNSNRYKQKPAPKTNLKSGQPAVKPGFDISKYLPGGKNAGVVAVIS